MNNSDVVVVSALLPATPESVFNAWIDPVQLSNWWGAGPEFSTGVVEVDPRPGGSYRLGMIASSGAEYIATGQYTEFEPGRKLSFSWRWEHSDESFPTTRIEVSFEAAEQGCRVEIRHHSLPDAAQRNSHEDGWKGCLQSLNSCIAS